MRTATTSRDRRADALRNEQQLVRAATAAIHREGLRVPLQTIASDAGVGIGTLYRHFPTRDDLLTHLTHRSFLQVLEHAQRAERDGSSPLEVLRLFVDAAIDKRNDLVLPLHGGPPLDDPKTIAVRAEVHTILRRVIAAGIVDGVLRPDVTSQDLVVFGAMLAQPRPTDPRWDATCRRLLTSYLRGLTA